MLQTRPAPRALPAAQPGLRRQRAVLNGYFFAAGTITALWSSQLTGLQARLHSTLADLSLGLLAAAAGILAGLRYGGRASDRRGPDRLIAPAALALAAAVALLATASSMPIYLVASAAFGAAHGLLDVGMNAAAARLQAAFDRPILQSVHAAYSLGALAGAVAAALASTTGISAARTFLIAAAVLAAAVLLAPALEYLPDARHAHGATMSAPMRPRVLVITLGALAMCSLLGDGTAADWSAADLHTVLHANTMAAATAYAVYSAATFTGRLAGDTLARTIGPVAHLRLGGLVAVTGLGAGLLIHDTTAALTGWALFGLGMSGVLPAAVTAAARARPDRAGRDIAAVSTCGYLGMVAGPALIGSAAETTSLGIALLLPAALALAVAIAASAVRPSHRH